MVGMLSAEVQRANKIITDLLDYSKSKKLNKLSIDIVSFINKVIPAVPLPTNIKVIPSLIAVNNNTNSFIKFFTIILIFFPLILL